MLFAVSNNEFDIATFLIDNGANIDFKFKLQIKEFHLNVSAYNIADSHDDQRLADFLELRGANTDKTDEEHIRIANILCRLSSHKEINSNEKLAILETLQNDKNMNEFLKKDSEYLENTKNEMQKIQEDNLKNFQILKVDQKIIEAIETKSAEKFQELIDVGFIMTGLDINELFENSYPLNLIQETIKQADNVNKVNKDGTTPLMFACSLDNISLIKLLLNKGADKTLKNINGKRAKDFTINQEIRSLMASHKVEKYFPQKLVNILKNFRKDCPMKFTTHDWDSSFKSTYHDNYKNFQGFLGVIKDEWNKVELDLKSLSPNLHKKIESFLISKEPSYSWYNKNGVEINLGWNSLDGLQEWCDAGNNPDKFKLTTEYKIEGKTITTFGEVIELFKHEIQFRNSHKVFGKKDMLEELFMNMEEHYDGKLAFEMTNLSSKEFYADVQQIAEGLEKIFNEIKEQCNINNELNKIKIEIIEGKDSNFYDLKIVHIGSKSGQSSKDMFEKITGGDSSKIKESLKNLCFWSIESSHNGENYRINYLKDNNIEDIEILPYEPEGFTHILRFYK